MIHNTENLEYSKTNPRKTKLNLSNPPTREVVLRVLSSGLGYPLTVTKKSKPSPPQPNCTKDSQRIKTRTTRHKHNKKKQPNNKHSTHNNSLLRWRRRRQRRTHRRRHLGPAIRKLKHRRNGSAKHEIPKKETIFERQNGEADLVGTNAGRQEEGKGGRKEEVKAGGGGGGTVKGAMARARRGSTSNG